MNCRKITAIASALGIVALSGCVSDQAEKTNEQNAQKILTQMQASPGWKFAEAESRRDAKAMFALAQDTAKKNPEDAKKLYARCAFVAAMQQNKTLFNEIAAADGSVKNYGSLIQKKSPSRLPQLVKVDSVAEAAKVGKGKQPVWGAFIADCYESLNRENAAMIAANVNSAREGFSAENLLAAAKDLAAYKAKAAAPEQLKIQTIIREAVNLAEVANEAKTMQAIVDFCKEKSLLPAKEQKELALTLKGMGKTRGAHFGLYARNGATSYQYRQGGWNVTNIRLSDGSVVTIRDDGTTREKLEAFKAALRECPTFCRYLNRGLFGKNSSYMTNGQMAQVFAVFQACAEEKGVPFSQVVMWGIREAENAN